MQYTKGQVIQFTIDNLSAIRVPALEAEAIGVPIQKCIGNLEIVMAMFEAEKNAKDKEAAPEGEDVPDGDTGEEDRGDGPEADI